MRCLVWPRRPTEPRGNVRIECSSGGLQPPDVGRGAGWISIGTALFQSWAYAEGLTQKGVKDTTRRSRNQNNRRISTTDERGFYRSERSKQRCRKMRQEQPRNTRNTPKPAEKTPSVPFRVFRGLNPIVIGCSARTLSNSSRISRMNPSSGSRSGENGGRRPLAMGGHPIRCCRQGPRY